LTSENEIQGKLLTLCQKEFPSRENLGIVSLSRIGDGWENDVYSFRMEYEKGGQPESQDLILRIYPGDDAHEKSAREFNVMKRLHEATFPVPEVLLLGSDDIPFGKPFVIMEKIEGRLMGDVFFESPRTKRRELLSLFCKMFVDLHKLDWKPFIDDPSSHITEDSDAFMKKKFSKWQDYFHSFRKDEFDPVFDWLNERSLSVRWSRPSLIHWDYHPWNVLLRNDGAPFIIDWTSAEVLDFRFDLAWTLLLIRTHAHRRMARSVLNEYVRIAGHRIEHLDFFEVAACARRLFSISVSLSDGAERMGMRPGAETVMKESAGPLKQVYALLHHRTGIKIPKVETLLSDIS